MVHTFGRARKDFATGPVTCWNGIETGGSGLVRGQESREGRGTAGTRGDERGEEGAGGTGGRVTSQLTEMVPTVQLSDGGRGKMRHD